MRRRRQSSVEPPPVPIPGRLLRPVVEDWIRPDEAPSPMYRPPMHLEGEDRLAWAFAAVAAERWCTATEQWLREHPHTTMPIREQRRWELVVAPSGGLEPHWRDRARFLASAVRP